MDVSRFRVGDWVLVVGRRRDARARPGRALGHDRRRRAQLRRRPQRLRLLLHRRLAWLLVVAAGVITFLLAARTIQRGTTPWTAAHPRRRRAGDAADADPRDHRRRRRPAIGNQDVTLGRGAGMFIALVAAIGRLRRRPAQPRATKATPSAPSSARSRSAARDERQSRGGDPLPPPTGEVPREPPTSPGR